MGKVPKSINFWMNWPEFIGLVLLIIGFFLAILIGSAVIIYILITLAGFIGGRIWYRVKKDRKVPWVIILIAFLLGFLIGARYGNKFTIMFFYVLGIIVSYYLHENGIIKSVEI